MKRSYSKHFQNILPIFMHSSYTQAVEFSDKIVLPRSVFLDIARGGFPQPPLFVMISDRFPDNSVYCAALEFASEEGFIYIPIHMFVQLGFRVINTDTSFKRENRVRNGLTLSTVEVISPGKLFPLRYNVPQCSSISVLSRDAIGEDELRDGLFNYTFVKKGESVHLLNGSKTVIVKVVDVMPEDVTLLSGSAFNIKILNEIPLEEAKERRKPELHDLGNEIEEDENTRLVPNHLGRLMKKQKLSPLNNSFLSSRSRPVQKNTSMLSIDLPNIHKHKVCSGKFQMKSRSVRHNDSYTHPKVIPIHSNGFIAQRVNMLPGFIRKKSDFSKRFFA